MAAAECNQPRWTKARLSGVRFYPLGDAYPPKNNAHRRRLEDSKHAAGVRVEGGEACYFAWSSQRASVPSGPNNSRIEAHQGGAPNFSIWLAIFC
jgi:hypothetical protein